jgi:hypothetical protein
VRAHHGVVNAHCTAMPAGPYAALVGGPRTDTATSATAAVIVNASKAASRRSGGHTYAACPVLPGEARDGAGNLTKVMSRPVLWWDGG